jgi:hypothetical protein
VFGIGDKAICHRSAIGAKVLTGAEKIYSMLNCATPDRPHPRSAPSALGQLPGTTTCAYGPELWQEQGLGLSLQDGSPGENRTKIDKILTIVLVLAIVLSVCGVIYLIIIPKQGEQFTEFYILGSSGIADEYPTDLVVGEKGTVIIGVVNHEYEDVSYQLDVRLDGATISEDSIDLVHNETWESLFTFQAMEKGENQKLEFLLQKDDVNGTYRSLHLWVHVREY